MSKQIKIKHEQKRIELLKYEGRVGEEPANSLVYSTLLRAAKNDEVEEYGFISFPYELEVGNLTNRGAEFSKNHDVLILHHLSGAVAVVFSKSDALVDVWGTNETRESAGNDLSRLVKKKLEGIRFDPVRGGRFIS